MFTADVEWLDALLYTWRWPLTYAALLIAAAHIGEAAYAYKLAKDMRLLAFPWALQTFFLGYPVLKSLLSLKRQMNSPVPTKTEDAVEPFKQGSKGVGLTGGCGFVGGYILRQLAADDSMNVTCFDLRIPEEKDRLPNVRYVRCDISNLKAAAKAFEGLTTVIHSAAQLQLCTTPRDTLWHRNYTMTQVVVDACVKAGVRNLVYTSSAPVLMAETPSDQPIPPTGWSETTPFPKHHIDTYTETKAAAEGLIIDAHESKKLRTCVLRPSGVYGLGDHFLADRALIEPPNQIIGSNHYKNDFVWVVDVARAHVLAAKKLDSEAIQSGEKYHITGEHISLHEFVGCNANHEYPEGFITRWGTSTPPKHVPVRIIKVLCKINLACATMFGRTPFRDALSEVAIGFNSIPWYFDNSKAKRELEWIPLDSGDVIPKLREQFDANKKLQ
eukprot:CFRG4078T1